jgi:predicted SnoaL-like aldol condensation-catalyzing enzyme
MTNSSPQKEAAVAFLHLVSRGEIADAYNRFVASYMKHHNMFTRAGVSELKKGMEENHTTFPEKQLEVQHVIEENDLVVVHSKMKLSKDMEEMALVQIFRFQNDKIVEMWDIGQGAPKEIINTDGMF